MMAAQILDIRAELEKRRAISELQKKTKVLTEKIREESRRIREAKQKKEDNA